MKRRTARRLAGTIVAAALAATIVSPLPAAADCAQAAGFRYCCSGCCCKSRMLATSNSSIGCHKSANLDTCVTRNCDCCRPSDPQNTPAERSAAQIPTGPIAYLPADAAQFHGGVVFAATFDAAHDGQFTAIPHRILHCSWLV